MLLPPGADESVEEWLDRRAAVINVRAAAGNHCLLATCSLAEGDLLAADEFVDIASELIMFAWQIARRRITVSEEVADYLIELARRAR